MSERRPLRVLIVEDAEHDAELIRRELERGGFDIVNLVVQTADAMRQAISQHPWDLVISDYSMPEFSATQALAVLRETNLDLPFIIVSGTIGEETAVTALKAGAHDFLSKGRLARLVPAINRELTEVDIRRERRKAENALRESEAKYRRIVETTQEGVWVVDADNRIVYSNRRMAQMLGVTPEALLGATVFDFIDEDWKPVALDHLERQRRLKVAEQHEFKFTRREGTELWTSLGSTPITDEAGAYAGTLFMVSDITEQRQLHEQLLISERMASVGILAAGVAHEINNPLTALLGNLELAIRDADECEVPGKNDGPLGEIRKELHDARDAAERVRNIVRDLRIFSRGDEEARRPVDVLQVLDSALRMAWNEIRHRARLVKDFQRIPPVDANESRLGQVFLNLLVNAAQAIPEGQAEANEIRVSTGVDPDGRVVVQIRDTGSGMSRDVMKRLFSPFFTTKPIGVGTGLGLSICHRIVTALGGEIRVESTPGKGSMFKVHLPSGTGPVEEAPSPPPTAVVARRGRVLVIDDEVVIGALVRKSLAADHEVTIATSAKEALAALGSRRQFDVILCDLMMPEMTGMDLYAELHRRAPEEAAKMIFLTGGAFTAKARAFLDEVGNLRLEKPFDLAALRAIVNDRIGRASGPSTPGHPELVEG